MTLSPSMSFEEMALSKVSIKLKIAGVCSLVWKHDGSVPQMFDSLLHYVSNHSGSREFAAQNGGVVFTYRDEDNDEITVGSSDDLMRALEFAISHNRSKLTLNVQPKSQFCFNDPSQIDTADDASLNDSASYQYATSVGSARSSRGVKSSAPNNGRSQPTSVPEEQVFRDEVFLGPDEYGESLAALSGAIDSPEFGGVMPGESIQSPAPNAGDSIPSVVSHLADTLDDFTDGYFGESAFDSAPDLPSTRLGSKTDILGGIANDEDVGGLSAANSGPSHSHSDVGVFPDIDDGDPFPPLDDAINSTDDGTLRFDDDDLFGYRDASPIGHVSKSDLMSPVNHSSSFDPASDTGPGSLSSFTHGEAFLSRMLGEEPTFADSNSLTPLKATPDFSRPTRSASANSFQTLMARDFASELEYVDSRHRGVAESAVPLTSHGMHPHSHPASSNHSVHDDFIFDEMAAAMPEVPEPSLSHSQHRRRQVSRSPAAVSSARTEDAPVSAVHQRTPSSSTRATKARSESPFHSHRMVSDPDLAPDSTDVATEVSHLGFGSGPPAVDERSYHMAGLSKASSASRSVSDSFSIRPSHLIHHQSQMQHQHQHQQQPSSSMGPWSRSHQSMASSNLHFQSSPPDLDVASSRAATSTRAGPSSAAAAAGHSSVHQPNPVQLRRRPPLDQSSSSQRRRVPPQTAVMSRHSAMSPSKRPLLRAQTASAGARSAVNSNTQVPFLSSGPATARVAGKRPMGPPLGGVTPTAAASSTTAPKSAGVWGQQSKKPTSMAGLLKRKMSSPAGNQRSSNKPRLIVEAPPPQTSSRRGTAGNTDSDSIDSHFHSGKTGNHSYQAHYDHERHGSSGMTGPGSSAGLVAGSGSSGKTRYRYVLTTHWSMFVEISVEGVCKYFDEEHLRSKAIEEFRSVQKDLGRYSNDIQIHKQTDNPLHRRLFVNFSMPQYRDKALKTYGRKAIDGDSAVGWVFERRTYYFTRIGYDEKPNHIKPFQIPLKNHFPIEFELKLKPLGKIGTKELKRLISGDFTMYEDFMQDPELQIQLRKKGKLTMTVRLNFAGNRGRDRLWADTLPRGHLFEVHGQTVQLRKLPTELA